MMAVEFRASLGSTVAANSHGYWQDGHAENGSEIGRQRPSSPMQHTVSAQEVTNRPVTES